MALIRIMGLIFEYVNICISKYQSMISANESIKKFAEIIKALGHPARIEILILLKNTTKKKMTVTQIHEELGLTQPETSRHLAVMKNGSVLHCEKEGSNSYYSLNDELPVIRCVASCMSKHRAE